MPSFLTNDRMSPALAGRIQRSLKAHAGQARLAPGALALLRLTSVAAIVACLVWLLSQHQNRQDDLDTSRTELLDRLHAEAAKVDDGEAFVGTLETWLVESSGVYGGDRVAPELRTESGLTAQLKRPSVYVRGPLTALGDHATLGTAAAESTKDALLSCLLVPPKAKDEADLLTTLRTIHGDDAPVEHAAHVERLYAALAGLPVLNEQWAERVRSAKDAAAVTRLQELFRLAPIEQAQRAAQSELFIFALDEPKTDNSPSEFDGTTRHFVRVHVVDLSTSTLLLRVRRLVDPAWISEAKRHRYAKALTDCRLAAEVHEDVRGNAP